MWEILNWLRSPIVMAGLLMGFGMGGGVWSAITADALLPMFPLAAGLAMAIVYLRRAPIEADIRAQVLVMGAQIKRVEDMLADETEAHDRTREKLRICKAAMADAGLRIIHLEAEAEADGHSGTNP